MTGWIELTDAEGNEMVNTADRSPEQFHMPADGGSTYDFGGVDFILKVSETGLSAGLAVAEYTTRSGEEPPDHVHPSEDEMFYVVDGAVTFRCAGRTFDVGRGGFVFLPRGIEHGYTIQSTGAVRLLVITSPPQEGAMGWGGFLGDVEASGQAVER
jgi:quercetin dioxygenase-like cupin family protein